MKRQTIIISKDNKKALEFLEKLRGRKQEIKKEIMEGEGYKKFLEIQKQKDGKMEIKT